MNRAELIDWLLRGAPRIVPSLLACDFTHLADEVHALERAGAALLHLDVMDGHFVPNLTYGPVVVKNLQRETRLVLDAHLMISEPEKFSDEFVDAGCKMVTIHVEATADPRPLLQRLRERDVVAGLSLKPSTPLEQLWPYLPFCDLVLVMSVEPGFGGQEFQGIALDKLRKLRKECGPGLVLEVDGGIKRHNAAAAAQAGSDLLVAGTAIFHSSDYAQELAELTKQAQSLRIQDKKDE